MKKVDNSNWKSVRLRPKRNTTFTLEDNVLEVSSKKGETFVAVGEKVKHHDYISKVHSCPCGKDVYETFSNAEKALKMRGKRGNKYVYKCSICGFYHLATKREKKANPYDKSKHSKKYKTFTPSESTLRELKRRANKDKFLNVRGTSSKCWEGLDDEY